MPPLLPTNLLSLRTCLRPYVAMSRYMASHSHEAPYDVPSGWFLNMSPGGKAEKEGWESIFYYGFFGSLFATAVAYVYKPDSS